MRSRSGSSGAYDLPGLVVFKFALVAVILLICETVGRLRHATGLRLARWTVALAAFPVLVGAFHVLQLALRAAEPAGVEP